MGAYEGTGRAKLLRENQQAFLWNDESVPAGVATSLSKAFQLERVRSVYYPWGFSVEVAFSGAPGTFAVNIMVSDTDNANNYINIGNISEVNATNVGRFDAIGTNAVYPKYVAVYMSSLTNDVNVTAQLTR